MSLKLSLRYDRSRPSLKYSVIFSFTLSTKLISDFILPTYVITGVSEGLVELYFEDK